MLQSNWAHVPQLLSLHSGTQEPQLLKSKPAHPPQEKKLLLSESWTLQLERSLHGSEDPAQSNTIKINKKKNASKVKQHIKV